MNKRKKFESALTSMLGTPPMKNVNKISKKKEKNNSNKNQRKNKTQ